MSASVLVQRMPGEWLRRYLALVVSLFILAFGISLSITAYLGCSPIMCFLYVLDELLPSWTLGMLFFCVNLLFTLAQAVLLGRDFQKIQWLQIILGLIFGVFTDFTMWLITPWLIELPGTIGIILRITQLLIGGFFVAFGFICEVKCNVLLLAGDGLTIALAKVLKQECGWMKICFDSAHVILAIILMLVFIGHWRWDMVGPGTLISMGYVGFVVRRLSPRMTWADRLFVSEKQVISPSSDAAVQ